jgi:hypothetical protein
MDGLLRHLFNADQAAERRNGLVVACSNRVWEGTQPSGAELSELIREMDEPFQRHGSPFATGHVLHLPITVGAVGAHATGSWRKVAVTVCHALGIGQQTRWVAVHRGRRVKGRDHIHLVANLIRTNGQPVAYDHSGATLRAALHRIDATALSSSTPSVELGSVPLTDVEIEQLRDGQVTDLADLPRYRLATTLRAIAATSQREAEYVAGLRREGLLLRARVTRTASDVVCGYSVAARVATGSPTWLAAETLTPSVALNTLRAHWGSRTPNPAGRALWSTEPSSIPAALPVDAAASWAIPRTAIVLSEAGTAAQRLAAAASLLASATVTTDDDGLRRYLTRAWWAADRSALLCHQRAPEAGGRRRTANPPPLGAAGDAGRMVATACRSLLAVRVTSASPTSADAGGAALAVNHAVRLAQHVTRATGDTADLGAAMQTAQRAVDAVLEQLAQVAGQDARRAG